MNSSPGKPAQIEVFSQEVDLFSQKKSSQHSPCKGPGQQLLQHPTAAKGRCPTGQLQLWLSPCSSLLCSLRASLPSSPAGARPLPSSGTGRDPWPTPECFSFSLCSFRVIMYGQKALTHAIRECQNKMLTQPNRLLWLAQGDDKTLLKYRKEKGRKWDKLCLLGLKIC